MKPIDRLVSADASEFIHAVGNYIWLKSATGQVFIETSEGETAFLSTGEYIRTDKEFKQFSVTDLSGANNDMTFVIGSGEAGKHGNVTIDTPDALLDIADVSILATTATQILAANSNRNEAIITALSTNAALARVGSSSVGAARGTILQPGATLFINCTAAIYAYSANAADFAINYTEF